MKAGDQSRTAIHLNVASRITYTKLSSLEASVRTWTVPWKVLVPPSSCTAPPHCITPSSSVGVGWGLASERAVGPRDSRAAACPRPWRHEQRPD
jgi:hypothetical protein